MDVNKADVSIENFYLSMYRSTYAVVSIKIMEVVIKSHKNIQMPIIGSKTFLNNKKLMCN